MPALHSSSRFMFAALVGLTILLVLAVLPPPSHSAAHARLLATPSDFQLRLAGRVEGAIQELTVSDYLLALAGRGSLTLYDIRVPDQPRILTSLTLPDAVTAIQISDARMYVTYGACEVFPISSCWGGMDVYDLAMPTAPQRLARLQWPTIPEALVVTGDVGFLRLGNDFYRLDLRIPSNPILSPYTVATSLDGPFNILAVVQYPERDGRAYAYLGRFRQIAVIDLTTNREVGLVTLPDTASSVHAATTFTDPAGRQLLYVSDFGSGMHIIDVTEPRTPQYRAMVDISNPVAAVIDAGVLYVWWADPRHGPRLLHMFDLDDPLAPQVSGAVDALPPFVGASENNQVAQAYTNGHLFTFDEERGVIAVDLRRPAAPHQHVTGITSGTGGGRRILATAGDTLLFGDRTLGWRLFDIVNPAAPRYLADISLPKYLIPQYALLNQVGAVTTGYLTHRCNPDGDLSVCPDPRTVSIYDLSDAAQPTFLNTIQATVGDWVNAMAWADGYLYLLLEDRNFDTSPSRGARLHIVDVRDPARPEMLGQVAFPGSPQDIAVVDGRAYVVTWWGGLHTIAIDDPRAPRLLSTYISHREMQAARVEADGAAVFVATLWDSELYQLDLSDPTTPVLVERSDLPGTSAALHLDGDTLITVGNGITVYQRGDAPDGIVRDARGAPMPDVTLQTTGSPALAAFTARATDIGGAIELDRSTAVGNLLTPQSPNAVFAPAARTVTTDSALDFVMLAAPVQAAMVPDTATTLAFTDTQGLVSTLAIPAESVATPATVTIRPQMAGNTDELAFAGQAFTVTLDGAPGFAQPVLLTLRYSRADVRLISDRNQVTLYRLVAGAWQPAANACADGAPPVHNPQARELQIAICEPGMYALLGPTVRIHLPLVVR